MSIRRGPTRQKELALRTFRPFPHWDKFACSRYGGAFRLICAIDFRRQVIFVKFLGTHAEYDAVDAATVAQYQETVMDIRPIRTRADHAAALREIDTLWGAPEGTDEGDRLDILLALVESYEAKTWPEPAEADPIAVIRYVMAENDYTQSDLAKVLGSRSRASEILSGRRDLTLEHIRRLGRAWHVPAGALIGEPEAPTRRTTIGDRHAH